MHEIRKVLILHTSSVMGGAEYSLLEFLNNLKGIPIEIHIAASSQIEELIKNKVEIPIRFHDLNVSYFRKYQNLKSLFPIFIHLIMNNYKILKLVKNIIFKQYIVIRFGLFLIVSQ